jgi:mannitol-specific phosphotransferase system IIBC component
MQHSNSTVISTAGGTFLSVLPNLHSEDVLKTIILATLGAIVSFIISLLLKILIRKHKK